MEDCESGRESHRVDLCGMGALVEKTTSVMTVVSFITAMCQCATLV